MYELSFDLETEDFGRVERVLMSVGAMSITQTEGDSDLFNEPMVSEGSSWSRCRLIALFNTEAESNFAGSQLNIISGVGKLKYEKLAEADWSTSWRKFWLPQTFSGGLCVCPSWVEPPSSQKYLVTLDPGQAFGTGSHETTSLCLSWLSQNVEFVEGAKLVDYGSGSGILGIAAIKLGAKQVIGVELDREAISVARGNARLNNAENQITFVEKLAPEVEGVADILVANILLKPISRLEPVFSKLIKPDGIILLSGILLDQVEELISLYKDRFSISLVETNGGWALLKGSRGVKEPITP